MTTHVTTVTTAVVLLHFVIHVYLRFSILLPRPRAGRSDSSACSLSCLSAGAISGVRSSSNSARNICLLQPYTRALQNPWRGNVTACAWREMEHNSHHFTANSHYFPDRVVPLQFNKGTSKAIISQCHFTTSLLYSVGTPNRQSLTVTDCKFSQVMAAVPHQPCCTIDTHQSTHHCTMCKHSTANVLVHCA